MGIHDITKIFSIGKETLNKRIKEFQSTYLSYSTKDYYMNKIVKYEKHPEMIKLKKIPLNKIENKDLLKDMNKFTNLCINKLCDHVQFKYVKSFSQASYNHIHISEI